MNTKLKSLLLLMVIAMSLFVVATAYATTPTQGEGTFELTYQDIHSIRQADGNFIVEQTLYFENVGAVTGPSIADVTCVVRDLSSGEGTCYGRETFINASVDNKEGTLVFNVVVTIDEAGNLQGRWTVISGTGELANLHGTGSLAGGVAFGTYTLAFHFDPY